MYICTHFFNIWIWFCLYWTLFWQSWTRPPLDWILLMLAWSGELWNKLSSGDQWVLLNISLRFPISHNFSHQPTNKSWKYFVLLRCKSLYELWVTTFLPERQQPLIFVWFTSNQMSTSHMNRAHAQFYINRTKMKGGCRSGRKVVTHNSTSDLPLGTVWIIQWCIHS